MGDVLADVTVQARAPVEWESDTEAEISLTGGGAAANVAATLASLGVETVLVGAVGQDRLGLLQLDDLVRPGLRLEVARRQGSPTGMVVALVDHRGARTMITSRGASRSLRPEQMGPALFQPGRHLHLSGYVLLDEESREAGLAALRAAHKAGMSISVDASSRAPLERIGAAAFQGWIRGASLLFANLDEARVLAGREILGEILPVLLEDCPEVVVKLGEEGACWGRGGERLDLAPSAAQVVDTTGAGDAFAAGWLASWLLGEDGPRALRAALDAAARAVGWLGGRPPA